MSRDGRGYGDGDEGQVKDGDTDSIGNQTGGAKREQGEEADSKQGATTGKQRQKVTNNRKKVATATEPRR
ncbi:hypothetical protein V500_07747 [Pseudogymnoascus sp. VKM F-4518 (FW-2643)]|nr:hypothetical protein V500_07747 [Pseudogymnoascus sp. VKM F-4518 (FW-2643)]